MYCGRTLQTSDKYGIGVEGMQSTAGIFRRAARQRSAGVVTKWLWYWGPVCGYAGLIFYLSSLPNPEQTLPELFQLLSDKALHAVEYAVLGGLCYRAFRWGTNEPPAQRALLLAIIAASLYGLSDELHQSFVPMRESSWLDAVADAIGSAAGAVLAKWVLTGPIAHARTVPRQS